ncbi:kielin/chordin-like protein isoform X2 [Dendronephthya gigantea]|nr:kielin/chordin-like protein isoform X2 [Dendronephthya gigantea]
MACKILLTFLVFTLSQQTFGIIFPMPRQRGGLSRQGKILEGYTPKCKEEGKEIRLPFKVPCTRCVCEGGSVICKKESCPSMDDCRGIAVLKPGTCCPECQESDNCLYQGINYKNGDTWLGQKCTSCSCNQGEVRCEQQVCETNIPCPKGMKRGLKPGACCESCIEETGICTSFGDPHYQTFDNRMYNYQGKCKYVFAKDCETNNFTIEVRNEGRHSRTFSWTKSVFLHCNGLEVALLQNLRVKINGVLVSLPYFRQPDLYIAENGYLTTVNTGIGVQVVWDGDSYTEVHVPKRYQNKTCGFCGNFNDDPSDDFMTPEGEVKTDTREFAISWQVRNKRMTACDKEESEGAANYPPMCTGENLMHARKKCFVLKNSKFAKCHGVVDPRPHFKTCVNDMCHCPRSQLHSCLCQSLTAYARLCQRQGVTINWRTKSTCGMKCQGGAVYDDCGPACRLTCNNKDDVNKVCTKPCVAGCQCPAGKVWNNKKKKCIPPSKCSK